MGIYRKYRREIEEEWITNFQYSDLVIKDMSKLDTVIARSLFCGVKSSNYRNYEPTISNSRLFVGGYTDCYMYYIPESQYSFLYTVNNLLQNDIKVIIDRILPYLSIIGIIIDCDKINKALNNYNSEIQKALFYATILNPLYFILKSFSYEDSDNFDISDPYYNMLANVYCLSTFQNETFEEDFLLGSEGYYKIGRTLVKTYYDEECAVYFLTRAIENGQRIDESFGLRAAANFRLNNFKEAINDIKRSNSIDRDLQFFLIESLNRTGNYEMSIQLALEHIKNKRFSHARYHTERELHISIIDSLTHLGKIDEAIKKIKEVEDRYPKTITYMLYANIYLFKGDYKQYLHYIKETLINYQHWTKNIYAQELIVKVKNELEEKQEFLFVVEFEDFLKEEDDYDN